MTFRRSFLAGAMITGLCASSAQAIDVAPGDFTYLPAGTGLLAGYLNYGNGSTYKLQNGSSVPNSRVESAVALARGVYYSEFAGQAFVVQAILPFGAITQARVGGVNLPKANGVGDLIVAGAWFPVHSMSPTGTTIAIANYLTLPTGNYSVTKASLGSGTVTVTPQLGLIQGLGNGFFVDGAIDAAFAFDHADQGINISQDPSIQAQAYLRYQFSKATSASLGYSGLFGGQFRYNGINQASKTRVDELRAYANTFLTDTVQLQGMIGTDVGASGGFRQAIVAQVRLLKVF